MSALVSKLAWTVDVESRRCIRPDRWTHTGLVRAIYTDDDGTRVLKHVDECPHRHRSPIAARACATKMADKMGWAPPACVECGDVYPGPRHEALHHGWDRNEGLQRIDTCQLMCARCLMALLDRIVDGLAATGRR